MVYCFFSSCFHGSLEVFLYFGNFGRAHFQDCWYFPTFFPRADPLSIPLKPPSGGFMCVKGLFKGIVFHSLAFRSANSANFSGQPIRVEVAIRLGFQTTEGRKSVAL